MSTRKNRVPVDVLQRRFLDLAANEGLTERDVAMRLGWGESRRKGVDGRRVLRALGLFPQISRGEKYYVTTLSERQALKLAQALHLDPWEVGL